MDFVGLMNEISQNCRCVHNTHTHTKKKKNPYTYTSKTSGLYQLCWPLIMKRPETWLHYIMQAGKKYNTMAPASIENIQRKRWIFLKISKELELSHYPGENTLKRSDKGEIIGFCKNRSPPWSECFVGFNESPCLGGQLGLALFYV